MDRAPVFLVIMHILQEFERFLKEELGKYFFIVTNQTLISSKRNNKILKENTQRV